MKRFDPFRLVCLLICAGVTAYLGYLMYEMSTVRVGQTWEFASRDPFEGQWRVVVVGCKDGYVQYAYCDFKGTNSSPLSSFAYGFNRVSLESR